MNISEDQLNESGKSSFNISLKPEQNSHNGTWAIDKYSCNHYINGKQQPTLYSTVSSHLTKVFTIQFSS